MRPTEGPPYLSCALFNSFPGKPQATQNINKEINVPLLHLLSFVVYWRFGKKPAQIANKRQRTRWSKGTFISFDVNLLIMAKLYFFCYFFVILIAWVACG